MKKLAPVILTLLLTGCASLQFPTSTQIGDAIAQVQALTKTLCSFEPFAASLAPFLPSGAAIPAVAATAVAQAICAAVTSPQSTTARKLGYWVVTFHHNGHIVTYPIRGHFVN